MARLGPTVVVRFLTTDTSLSTDSVGVWAQAIACSEELTGRVTIAVVDPVREQLQAGQVGSLEQASAAFSVAFRYEAVAPGTTMAAAVTALDVEADDFVLLADPADVPSPGLIDRLFASLGVSDVAIVDAQTLPMTPSRHGLDDDDDPAPAGVCVMLSGRVCRELGDFDMSAARLDIAELIHRARGKSLRIVSDPAAAVFCDVRVGADVQPLAAGVGDADVAAVDDGPARLASRSHPAALEATSLGEVIRASGVTQLIEPEPDTAVPSCFLTVLTRTQGNRPQCLEEMLLCLAAQTVRDFEVVLACHRVSESARTETEEILARFPEWLQSRVRIIEVDRPGRAAPLNDGLETANGRYVVILDDDDIVFAHWVQTFMEMEHRAPGRLLRAATLRQDVKRVEAHGRATAVPVGQPRCVWPLSFELVDHLNVNATPCMTVAFPRGVYHALRYRFIESMMTTEDWEYLVRAAAIVGVESDPAITSVYRWWVDEGSSRTEQSTDDWDLSRELAERSFDDRILLLPRGSARRIRELFDQRSEALAEAKKAVDAHGHAVEEINDLIAAQQRTGDRARAAEAKVHEVESRLRQQTRRAEQKLARMHELDGLLASRAGRGADALGTAVQPDVRAEIFEMSQGELKKRIAELKKNQRNR